jgi:hypothetical protein
MRPRLCRFASLLLIGAVCPTLSVRAENPTAVTLYYSADKQAFRIGGNVAKVGPMEAFLAEYCSAVLAGDFAKFWSMHERMSDESDPATPYTLRYEFDCAHDELVKRFGSNEPLLLIHNFDEVRAREDMPQCREIKLVKASDPKVEAWLYPRSLRVTPSGQFRAWGHQLDFR